MSKEIIKVLRIGHRHLTPGAELGHRGNLVVNVPQTRFVKIYLQCLFPHVVSLLEIPPDTDVGPCNGFTRSYLAYCNYFATPARPELIRWIDDLQETNNHGKHYQPKAFPETYCIFRNAFQQLSWNS